MNLDLPLPIIYPLSFSKYISENDFKTITKLDSIVHLGRYENYKYFSAAILRDLESTKLNNEQKNALAKTWHLRQERVTVGLRFQIQLKEQGKELLELLESKYHH